MGLISQACMWGSAQGVPRASSNTASCSHHQNTQSRATAARERQRARLPSPAAHKFMLGRLAQRPVLLPWHSRSTSSWMNLVPPVKRAAVSSQPKKLVGKLQVGRAAGRGARGRVSKVSAVPGCLCAVPRTVAA